MAHRPSLNSVVARRLLRYELERMCFRAGVTHVEMGARLSVSRAAFSQFISGKTLPSRPALEVIAHHLGEPRRLPRLLELRTAARSRAKVDIRSTVRDEDLAAGLEAFARLVEVFDPAKVTPLLQTPDYARELAVAVEPLLLRQRMLTADQPAELRWVVEEHALRRPVGSAAVMGGQFRHLLAMSDRPNIEIQVIPSGVCAPPTGAFQLIRSEEGTAVAHELTRRTAHYYDDPDDVADYSDVMSRLQRLALDPVRSRDVLSGLAEGAPPNSPL